MRDQLGRRPTGSESDGDLHPTQDWRDIEAPLVALDARVQSWQRRIKESSWTFDAWCK